MRKGVRQPDQRQADLFDAGGPFFPIRSPLPETEALSFDGGLRRAISRALRECGMDREIVAARMAAMLDRPAFSKHMLDAYTAESRESHRISVDAFLALIRVTGAIWLLDVLAKSLGCLVLEGEEARLAELGRLELQEQEIQRQKAELKQLSSIKIQIRRRRS